MFTVKGQGIKQGKGVKNKNEGCDNREDKCI